MAPPPFLPSLRPSFCSLSSRALLQLSVRACGPGVMSVLLRRAALEGLLCGPPSLVPSLLVRPNSGELGEGEGRTGGASQPLLAHVRTRSGRGAPQQPDSPGGLDTTRGGKKGVVWGHNYSERCRLEGRVPARTRPDPCIPSPLLIATQPPHPPPTTQGRFGAGRPQSRRKPEA